MLLDREGMRRRFLVDAGKSFYGGKTKKNEVIIRQRIDR